MTLMDEERDEGASGEHDGGTSGEPGEDPGRVPSRLPLLLDAVLGVGTDLELRATLQHIVDSATELTGARYGALGVV
ncbi:histidine kinase, partial [Streptomyces cinereoruber]